MHTNEENNEDDDEHHENLTPSLQNIDDIVRYIRATVKYEDLKSFNHEGLNSVDLAEKLLACYFKALMLI